MGQCSGKKTSETDTFSNGSTTYPTRAAQLYYVLNILEDNSIHIYSINNWIFIIQIKMINSSKRQISSRVIFFSSKNNNLII